MAVWKADGKDPVSSGVDNVSDERQKLWKALRGREGSGGHAR